MTLPAAAQRIAYTGDGTTDTFPYPFTLYAASELQVWVSGAVVATGYSVTNVGVDGGGNVEFTSAPANLAPIVLLRATALAQAVDILEGVKLPAEQVEGMFDRLTAIAQDLDEQLTRTLKLGPTATHATSEPLMPDLATVAGKTLKVRDDGLGLDAYTLSGTPFVSPITSPGDLIRGSALGLAERLALGTAGDLLTVVAGMPEWQAFASQFLTLLTANGDLLYRNGSGMVTRLPIGTAAQILSVVAGLPAWTTISTVPRSYLAGLGLANNGTDPTNDVDVAAGIARDGADTDAMTLATLTTKQLDANWAVGSGQGGLDTGAKAINTWYHVWLIKRPDTGVVDVLYSLSAITPTLPPNYTLKRRLGAVRTDASGAVRRFHQDGDYVGWDSPTLDANDTNLSTAATAYTLSVPPGERRLARVNVFMSGSAWIYLRDDSTTDQAPSTTVAPLVGTGTAGTNQPAMIGVVRTNSSGQVHARSTGAFTTLRLATLGYWDRRGRDD